MTINNLRWLVMSAASAAAMTMAGAVHANEVGAITTQLAQATSGTEASSELDQAGHLEEELEAVRQELIEAEEAVASYEGGLLLVTAQMRLETLKLTEALLEQRVLALREGADFTFDVPAIRPNPELAQEVLADIERTKEAIAEAEQEAASYSGGLLGIMALSNAMTQKLTLATLERRYYELQYGILAPAGAAATDLETAYTGTTETGEASTSSGSRPELETGVAALEAPQALEEDPEPESELEELSPHLEAARSSGSEIVGNWAVTHSLSPIDDFPNVVGLNFEEGASASVLAPNASMFTVRCMENQTQVGVFIDTYLLGNDGRMDVVYRIDDQPAVETSWEMSTNNKFVGLWGARQSAPLIKSLLDAEKVFIQITERRGTRHRSTFMLEGIKTVAAEVADKCGWDLDEGDSDA